MFSEKIKIVPVANNEALDPATAYTDGINMANFHRATFILQFHTLGGADTHVWVYSGASEGSYTSTVPYRYAFGGATIKTANCDKLAAWTAADGATALHITNATYSGYMLIIEVDASDMDVANQEEWLSIGFLDTDTGCTGNVTVVALLSPRYTSNRSASALA